MLIATLFAFEKLDWKYSIKAPYYFPKVGDVPFWTAQVSHHSPTAMRLSSSMVGSTGKIMSEKVPYSNWRINAKFRISGDYYGGQGFGIFFTEDAKFSISNTLGVASDLKGIGIVFSASDSQGLRQNAALVSLDGTPITRLDDFMKYKVASCFGNFRNTIKDFEVSLAYFNAKLRMDIGESKSLVECFNIAVNIPKEPKILISAESGQNPDDHDLISFELFDLDAKMKEKQVPVENKEDMDRLEKMERKIENEFHRQEKHQPPIAKQGIPELQNDINGLKTTLNTITAKLDAMDGSKMDKIVEKLEKLLSTFESKNNPNIEQEANKLQSIQEAFKKEIDSLKSLILRAQVHFYSCRTARRMLSSLNMKESLRINSVKQFGLFSST